jgi:hypothetical protein
MTVEELWKQLDKYISDGYGDTDVLVDTHGVAGQMKVSDVTGPDDGVIWIDLEM